MKFLITSSMNLCCFIRTRSCIFNGSFCHSH